MKKKTKKTEDLTWNDVNEVLDNIFSSIKEMARHSFDEGHLKHDPTDEILCNLITIKTFKIANGPCKECESEQNHNHH